MIMRAKRVRPVFLFALAAVVMMSCRDAAGPGAIGHFALAPSFASAAAGIVEIAQVRVRLFRADESLALDETVTVPAGADSLALELTVTLNEPNEVFQMFLDFITPPPASDTAFRAGPVTVTASSTSTEPVPVEVDAVYVGVGANAASVVITTKGATVQSGQTVQLSAEALDGQGQPIPGTPIAWSSLDPTRATVPDPAVGLVLGGTEGGFARIVATLLTGPADTADVFVRTGAGQKVSWANAADGNWSDAANWSTGMLPQPEDTAVIDLAGVYTVTLDATAQVGALELGGVSGLQALVMNGTQLTLVENSTVSVTGALYMGGNSAVVGPNTLTVAGVLRVSGGVAVLDMALANSGTLDVLAGGLEVKQGGTSGGMINTATGTSTSVSGGTVDVTGGSVTVNGSLAVLTGATVRFNGGTHSFSASSSISGAGDIDFAGGLVTLLGGYGVSGSTSVSGGTVSFENTTTPATTTNVALSSGTLSGAGEVSVSGTLSWSGGTMGGSGLTRVGAAGGGTWDGGAKVLDGRALRNEGNVVWAMGNLDLQNGASLLNAAGATMDVQAPDGSVLDNTVGGPVTLTNDGTLVVASDGVVSVTADMVNSGTLDIQAGSLDPNGSFSHTDGAVLQGTGALSLTDATVTALDGDVRPGTSPGALTVEGALPLSTLSTVSIELNGTTAGSQYDQLTILGRATFGGVLDITAGFTPVVGDQFTVMTFSGGRAGGFSAVNGLDLGGGIVLDTVWTATALTLAVPAPKIVFAGDSGFGLSTGIFTVNPDGTGLVHVDTLIPLSNESQYPRWSPDRKRIAYSWDGGVFGPLQLYVTSGAAGGLPQAVVTDTSTFRPRWNPNGVRLAFECGNGFSIVDVCVIADVTGAIGSLPVNTYTYVTDAAGIPPAWQGGQSGFDWDPQKPDELVFARDSTGVETVSTLWTAAYDGTGVQRLTPDSLARPSDGAPLIVYGPLDYSPDGQQIVFAAYSPVDAIPMEKLFVINRDGTNLRQLTFLPGYDDSPLFAPDGSEVAFGRDLCFSTGTYEGWIVDINNPSDLERQLTDHGGVTCDYITDRLGGDWSPDGSQIVLNGFDAQGNLLIYVVPRTVTKATYFTDRAVVGPLRGGTANPFEVTDIQPSWRP